VTGVQCFRSVLGNRRFGTLQKTLHLISSGCLNVAIIGGPFRDLAGGVTLPHIACCQVFVQPCRQLDLFTLNVGTATFSEVSETLKFFRGKTCKSDPREVNSGKILRPEGQEVTWSRIYTKFRNDSILDLYFSPNVNSIFRLHEGTLSRCEACMRIGEKPEDLERKYALGGTKLVGGFLQCCRSAF
jgi:hypothetical protein